MLPYWGQFCEVKEYYFAFNDKYLGSTGDIEMVLSELKIEHKLNDVCLYLAKHLEEEYINLDEDQISMIVGGLPSMESSSPMDFSYLNEVINHIQRTPPSYSPRSELNAPDIYEKIRFNGLNEFGHYIKAKQYQIYQIDDFFSKNSDFIKQTIRDHLAGYYNESLNKFSECTSGSEEGNNLGDLRFAFILNKIAPKTDNPAFDRSRRDAALVLMAKYFETCDIFEKPKHVVA